MTACADVIRSSKETWSCSLLQPTKSSSGSEGKDRRERERRRDRVEWTDGQKEELRKIKKEINK